LRGTEATREAPRQPERHRGTRGTEAPEAPRQPERHRGTRGTEATREAPEDPERHRGTEAPRQSQNKISRFCCTTKTKISMNRKCMMNPITDSVIKF
jgi:hypothetical protein